jgi:hypothetical protein
VEQVVVWTEVGPVTDASAQSIASLVAATTDPSDVVSIVILGEDRALDRVVVVGVPDVEAGVRVAHEVERAAAEAGGELPSAPIVYTTVQRIGSGGPRRDQAILTVRLPVPEGQEHLWNRWYLDEHMTSLLAQVGDSLISGTRYGPVGGATDYLVAYDFNGVQSMRDWVDGLGIQGKRSSYRERWHVINQTRAFVPLTSPRS